MQKPLKKKLVIDQATKVRPLTTEQLGDIQGGGEGVPKVIEGAMAATKNLI